jgi:hypothetical protein
MGTEDLFGLRSNHRESARAIVEKAFEVTLEPRHSSYHGGDYYNKRLSNKDEFILQVNSDGDEGGYAEEDYKDFGILLYVYSPVGCDRYKKALNCSGFVPLERSVTTPSRILRRIRFVDGAEEIYFEKQLDPV